jgi:hypothetical protein
MAGSSVETRNTHVECVSGIYTGFGRDWKAQYGEKQVVDARSADGAKEDSGRDDEMELGDKSPSQPDWCFDLAQISDGGKSWCFSSAQ